MAYRRSMSAMILSVAFGTRPVSSVRMRVPGAAFNTRSVTTTSSRWKLLKTMREGPNSLMAEATISRALVTGSKGLQLSFVSTVELDDWSGRRDSNPRHRPWQGRTLPAELLPLEAKLLFSLENEVGVKLRGTRGLLGTYEKGGEDCRSSESEICCRHLFTLRSRAVFRCFSLRFPVASISV